MEELIKINNFPNPEGLVCAFFEQAPHGLALKNTSPVEGVRFLLTNNKPKKADCYIKMVMFTPASYAKYEFRLCENLDIVKHYSYIGTDKKLNQFTVHKIFAKYKPKYVLRFNKYEHLENL